MMTPDRKMCAACREEKLLAEFTPHKKGKYGVETYCRACTRIKSRQYRAANAERLREYFAQWHAKHPEYRREQSRERRAKDPESCREHRRQWYKKNPERGRIHKKNSEARRRAKVKGGMSSAELREWESQQPKICHWCGKKCAVGYHVDHRQPLAKGGKHESRNLCVSCPTCNARKGAKDPIEFAQSLGRLV